jgi:Putative lumazine-binding
MKKFTVLFILIGIGSLFFGYKIVADSKERDLVKVPLENYLQAHAGGNPELIRKAFHADARITAFREGKLVNLSTEEFASRFNGKAADDEAKRKRSIESIDISGNAAIAKIILDYPTVKFTDYMTLLKIGDEWKIVNKSFYAEMKEQSKK